MKNLHSLQSFTLHRIVFHGNQSLLKLRDFEINYLLFFLEFYFTNLSLVDTSLVLFVFQLPSVVNDSEVMSISIKFNTDGSQVIRLLLISMINIIMVFLQPMWINLRSEMSNFPLIPFVKFPACW